MIRHIFKALRIFTKNGAAKPSSLLVNDTTLAPDNPLRFRKNMKANNDN